MQAILNEAISLFDTAEKWDSFISLCNQKDSIKNHWYSIATEYVSKYFYNNPIPKWSFYPSGPWDYHWYITDCGEKSISLWWGWATKMILWVDPAVYKIDEIQKLLKEPPYIQILALLRNDAIFQGQYILQEIGNLHFDSEYDGHMDQYSLAWFAGNKPAEFCSQLIEKVQRFTNNDITLLLTELNIKTKTDLTR
jgi:hypothetical protein